MSLKRELVELMARDGSNVSEGFQGALRAGRRRRGRQGRQGHAPLPPADGAGRPLPLQPRAGGVRRRDGGDRAVAPDRGVPALPAAAGDAVRQRRPLGLQPRAAGVHGRGAVADAALAAGAALDAAAQHMEGVAQGPGPGVAGLKHRRFAWRDPRLRAARYVELQDVHGASVNQSGRRYDDAGLVLAVPRPANRCGI